MNYLKGLIIFLFLSSNLFSQSSTVDHYNKIDNKIFSFSKKGIYNFDTIVSYVNEKFTSDDDKIRAFYTWIALNISYDQDLLETYKINSQLNLRFLSSMRTQHPDTVLKYRKGVCEGFSLLMNKFCESSSIMSHMVVGYTKNESDEVTQNILHAWNAIKLDTTWFILDITWSNGYVNYTNKYIKKFSDHYFFTSPDEFLKDHLPLDPMWQLQYYPTTKAEFFESKTPEHKLYFNYKDSITSYLKFSKDTLEFIDLMHNYRFDPENNFHALGYDQLIYNRVASLLNIGAAYYDDYRNYAKKLENKPMTDKNIKMCLKLLEEPRKYLEKGLAFIGKKDFFNKNIQADFDEMLKIADNNHKDIIKTIIIYKKFLKKPAGNKK